MCRKVAYEERLHNLTKTIPSIKASKGDIETKILPLWVKEIPEHKKTGIKK